MPYVLAFFAGYLVGSVPSAFLLVRRAAGMDIRTSGSGNVGGYNAFTVTNSKWIGIAVGVLDGLKGLIVVLAAGWLTGGSFWVQSTALCGALIGHNYPVWLRFRGGRGLATAAMGSLPLGLPGLVVWGLVWIIVYRQKKDILIGNLAAIIMTPVILFAIPSAWLAPVVWSSGSPRDFAVMMAVVSGIHLIRHWDAVKVFADQGK